MVLRKRHKRSRSGKSVLTGSAGENLCFLTIPLAKDRVRSRGGGSAGEARGPKIDSGNGLLSRKNLCEILSGSGVLGGRNATNLKTPVSMIWAGVRSGGIYYGNIDENLTLDFSHRRA